MSNKAKLITVISAFVLVVSLLTVGVFAVQSATVNMGGTITFNATDVQATISAATVANGTVTDAAAKLQEIKFDADNDGSTALATWGGLDIAFAAGGDDVTITFTITNDHAEKGLVVTTTPTPGTAVNMTMTTTVEGGTGTVENNTIAVGGSAEYTVTFHIANQNASASITGFNLAVGLTMAE